MLTIISYITFLLILTNGTEHISASVERGFRIVGGQLAKQGQFPYIATLREANSLKQLCDGAIISEEWIITARHCTQTFETYKFKMIIGVGGNKLNDGQSYFGTKQYVNHPQYNVASYENDIALIRLNSTLQFSPGNVERIEFGNAGAGDSCIISGWGLTDGSSTTAPNDLYFIETTAISVPDCEEKLQNLATDMGLYVGAKQICTESPRGQGSCRGDSGGPVVCNGRLAGVVSIGDPKCAQGNPDAATRVSVYEDWIRAVTGIN